MINSQDCFSDLALTIVSFIPDQEKKLIYIETANRMSDIDQQDDLSGTEKKLHVLSSMKNYIESQQLDWQFWQPKLDQFIDHLKDIHHSTIEILH
ncbi:hypothetical protein ACG9Z8_09800 [Acinetobacter ursingii]|uniref:hypothetical protein n=1 Tax=Acinetobacter ursingii TaxID=108980 RepID=UPI00300AE512